MRILTISSLYPNNEDPKHGIFVENRLRNLLKDYSAVSATVIAPIPWFPIKTSLLPEYAKYVDVLEFEIRHGIEIHHPRYLVIPKIGMLFTPFFMSISIFLAMRKNIKRYGRPDLVDGHYFYPDGVAMAIVCRWFDIPFTCTSRGTDLNLISDMPWPRKMIKWTIKQAKKCMAVCQALTDRLVELGAEDPITLRNGVDLNFFVPLNEEERCIKRNDLFPLPTVKPNIILSVGWLIERKGHHLIIQALRHLSNTHLFIAGNGPDLHKLEGLVNEYGLNGNVTFLGSLDQKELRQYYQTADALVLASSREGWANVLLESMACGTPVVATNIWGTPEVVKSNDAGLLCERNDKSIAQTLGQIFDTYPARTSTRAYAEQFDWYSTSKGQYDIFSAIIEQRVTRR